MGCYGYTLNTSSYIDRFAEESVLFEYAVAQSSWTAPSVASLFTSLYPYSHNVRKKNEALSLDVITLAEIMKENGYRTFGLVSNPVLKRKMQYYQGFDYYEFLTPRAGLYAERGALVVKNFFDILDRKSEERFFGYIHLMDPHLPYQPHPKYANRFIRSGYRGLFKKLHIPHSVRFKKTLRKLKPRDLERIIALYDAEINYSDDNFKKIISGLKKRRLLKNTILIFTSDHGEEFLERGGLSHGKSYYQEIVKVPLIIRYPGMNNKGKRIQQMVRLIDIMPTILDLTKIKTSITQMGTSLLPLMESKYEKNWKLINLMAGIHEGPDLDQVAIQSEDYKLIKYFTRPRIEFFDLNQDPKERNNITDSLLIPKYTELLETYQKLGGNIAKDALKIKWDEKTKKQLESLGYAGGGKN